MPGGTLITDQLSPDWLASGNWLLTTTPNGISYAVLFDSYREQYARDASQVVALIRCRWNNRLNFRKEMLGYTVWAGWGRSIGRGTKSWTGWWP